MKRVERRKNNNTFATGWSSRSLRTCNLDWSPVFEESIVSFGKDKRGFVTHETALRPEKTVGLETRSWARRRQAVVKHWVAQVAIPASRMNCNATPAGEEDHTGHKGCKTGPAAVASAVSAVEPSSGENSFASATRGSWVRVKHDTQSGMATVPWERDSVW